ncbi:MAG: hypothetical protein ISS69_01235 [Phycisphaerae bacterium]|nr:hypothetical protein [Phycisphaerae bacterium]
MRRCGMLACLLICLFASVAQAAKLIELSNEHIRVDFRLTDGVWANCGLSRADGSDAITLDSDEFEILLFDDTRFTAADYQADEPKQIVGNATPLAIQIQYKPKASTSPKAPRGVMVTYEWGTGPYLYKTVTLTMKKGEKIDRLSVLRFSAPTKASRGGRGEAVFLGNWFVGADYPCFYSRHSDGFANPDYFYRWDYMIDLDGRDKIFAPRKGLVSVFHFPGYAREQAGGKWAIVSKRAVMGLSKTKGDNAELALFDYIAETRKPPRSHLHYNNWYSPEGKNLGIDHFISNVYKPINDKLKKYGAKLDAIVPDHGWQNTKAFEYIFQPQVSASHSPLPELSKALMDHDKTHLGIWMALDGTNNSTAHGLKIGYKPAYAKGFKREARWMEGKAYFDILDPKYQRDLKKALKFLIADAGVDYIKHDFNHNFTSNYITQRHAREACLDVTLDLLKYERSLNPKVYQNYTNGSWFSPWWLQHVDSLWMMSGDSGNSRKYPHLAHRDRSTSYRDEYFFQNFNNPQRTARPIIPIANFMTHGIIYSAKKPFTDGKDLLENWSNHVVMYCARGTMVKELYLTPKLINEDQWEVLGRASDWAQRNQDRLKNTVIIGGNPGKGEIYGFVSWVGDRAILTVRNPNRNAQRLTVPFDAAVYYRGAKGKAYRARAIYPFVKQMSWHLTSGKPFKVTVPGDTVIVCEIDPGRPPETLAVEAKPLPAAKAAIADKAIVLKLQVPDEAMKRYELVVQPWGTVDVELTVDGKTVPARQSSKDARWSIHAFDLAPYRGKTIMLQARLKGDSAAAVSTEAWIIADRPVKASPAPTDQHLPHPISQNYRRVTQNVLTKQKVAVAASK